MIFLWITVKLFECQLLLNLIHPSVDEVGGDMKNYDPAVFCLMVMSFAKTVNWMLFCLVSILINQLRFKDWIGTKIHGKLFIWANTDCFNILFRHGTKLMANNFRTKTNSVQQQTYAGQQRDEMCISVYFSLISYYGMFSNTTLFETMCHQVNNTEQL